MQRYKILILKMQRWKMNINEAITDSCFEQDLINRIICKIKFELNPDSPPYETNYEFRDNYSLRN